MAPALPSAAHALVQRISCTTSLVSVGPLHEPGVMLKMSPTVPGSEPMRGSEFHRGAAGMMTEVAVEAEATDPSAFVAVTTATSVCPTSAAAGVYCPAVAPAIAAQLLPVVSQRSHASA